MTYFTTIRVKSNTLDVVNDLSLLRTVETKGLFCGSDQRGGWKLVAHWSRKPSEGTDRPVTVRAQSSTLF